MSKVVEEAKKDVQETLENAVDAAENVIDDVQDKIDGKKPGFLKRHGKTIATHTIAFIAGVCVATVKRMFFGGAADTTDLTANVDTSANTTDVSSI